MPDWSQGEDKRLADWRDEYQRPKGKHRAQPVKPPQGGPSLPPGSPDVAAALEGLRALIDDVVGVIGASDGNAVRTRTLHARAALVLVTQALAERTGWEEIAAQESRNRDYYRGLVVEIGELFGDAAKVADDGGLMEDVLCAKVPNLVRAQQRALADQPRLPPRHTTTLTQSPTMLTYWWTCTCGDEGGPYDHYTPAWDATVDHERGPAMSTKGEPMTLTPKQEIIVTLEAAWKLLDGAEPPAVRLAQLRGLIDHSRALAQRVGEAARPRKAEGVPPNEH